MLYDMSRLSNDPGRPAGADGRRQPQNRAGMRQKEERACMRENRTMADKNFLTEIIDADLAAGKVSEIHTPSWAWTSGTSPTPPSSPPPF